jgi:hypothetical protein
VSSASAFAVFAAVFALSGAAAASALR